MKNPLHHTIRIAIGIIFIISATLKMLPIEPFELFVFGNGIPNWDIASISTRLIISVELFIGLMLIFNLFAKFIQRINIIILIAFSFLLTYYAIAKPEISNCNCFGEKFELSPINSIIKNILLLIASIYVYYSRIPFKMKLQKPIIIALIIIVFAGPLIISPPDFVYDGNYQRINEKLDSTLLKNFTKNDKNIIANNGKVIICFFSTACKYCKLAAKKISIIDNIHNNKLNILYVFMGSEVDLDNFWSKSESNKYPYIFIPTQQFLKLSGKSLPKLYFVNNGIKLGQANYRDFSENDISNFLKN